MKKGPKRGLWTLATVLLLSAPVWGSYLGGYLTYKNAPKITTTKELREAVGERAERLGMEVDSIDFKFIAPEHLSPWNGTEAMRNNLTGQYFMRFKNPTSIPEIDHELFHIYAGHVGPGNSTWGFKSDSPLTELLIEEPHAHIYATTGAKLNKKEVKF